MLRARRLPPFVFVWLCATLTPAGVRADDMSSLLQVLEENVVTGASRSAEASSDAPAVSSVITGEQLRRFGIRRLDEALNYLSLGVFAHDRLSTPEVGARGLALTRDTNSHMLVVLDGMVVNEQAGGAVFLHDIPMDLVDHIEVILGPGAVLYGAQAMLGVINIVTKNARHHDGLHATMQFGASPPLNAQGGIAAPTLGALGHDHHYAISLGRSFQILGYPASLTALVDHSDFKGPQIEFARQRIPSQSDGTPAFDPGPHARAGFWGGPVSEQWFRRTSGTYAQLEVGELTWATRVTSTRLAMPQMDLFENRVGGAYDDPHNNNSYATVLSNLRYQHRLSTRLTMMARLYGGYSRAMSSRIVLTHDELVPGVPLGVIDPEQCPVGPEGPCRKESSSMSRWIGIEPQLSFDWLDDGRYTTMAGVDARLRTAAYEYVAFDEASGRSFGSEPALTRWHGGGSKKLNESAVGPYIEQKIKPWKSTAINAGLRFDYDSRIASKDAVNALSPRLALVEKVTQQLSLKAIYSTAFRAPSFLELYSVSGRLLPNPLGLQPETVSSYELVADVRLGAHVVSISGFYAQWRNLIELEIVKAQAPSVSRYSNVSSVRNLGTNMSYETSFFERRLRAGINVTVATSRRQLSDEQRQRNAPFGAGDTAPMTVAPHVFGNARMSYTFDGASGTALSIAGGFLGRRLADQAYYGANPSNLTPRPYAAPQLEIRAMLTGDVPGFRGVSYSLGGNYAFGSEQPYVVGPNQGLPQYLVSTPVEGHLAPVNRLSVLAGMEYHFGEGAPGTSAPAGTVTGQ